MKTTILNLLLLLQCTAFSQLVEYSAVLLDQCETLQETSDWWYLVDQGNNKLAPKSGKVFLEINKEYSLICGALKSEPTVIILSEKTPHIDTFFLSKLEIKYPENHFTWHPDYYACGTLINGAYTEHYKNGTLRYKGNFDCGKVSDTLKSYFKTGELKAIHIAAGKHIIYNEYFKNGRLTTAVNTQKKYRYYYYESGALKSKMHNHKNKHRDYFENGVLQADVTYKEEYIYYANGNLKGQLKKSRYKFLDRFKLKKDKVHYFYYWTEFDSLGTKKRQTVFKSNAYYSLFNGSIHQFSKADYFSVEFYAAGERKAILEHNYDVDDNGNSIFGYFLYRVEQNEVISREVLSLEGYMSTLEKLNLEFGI